MDRELQTLHLHMFDGEGAGGAEAGISDDGGAESKVEPAVVYGKAEADDEAGQVGADSEEGEDAEELGAEFEELISGKYKEQFGSRVNDIMQRRFKNTPDYQEQAAKWQDATAILAAKYGLDGNDPEALKKAIESDDGIFSENAEKEGLTAERYRENLRLRLDAAKGRSLQEEMEREIQRRETFARWDAEAEVLKEAFPNFDLNAELDNQVFLDSLNRGNDVRQSFFIAHMDEVLSGSIEAAEDRGSRQTVDNFRQRQARPAENGMSHQPAVIRKDDPSKLTDAELDEVVARARRGESIKF